MWRVLTAHYIFKRPQAYYTTTLIKIQYVSDWKGDVSNKTDFNLVVSNPGLSRNNILDYNGVVLG